MSYNRHKQPNQHAPMRGMPAAPGAQLDEETVQRVMAVPAAPRVAAAGTATVQQPPFDLYVVLDFEATCEEGRRLPQPEIIELPFVLVDPRRCAVVGEFQRYVRPVLQPHLSAFCTSLTGIEQATVDRSATFAEAFAAAKQYLLACGLGDAPPYRSYCIVTCGDWDLGTMLPAQLRVSGALGVPPAWQRWCNLKHYMKGVVRGRDGRPAQVGGMPDLLRAVGLELQGRHHSGIDDCRNIAAVVCALLKQGLAPMPTRGGAPPHGWWHADPSAGWPSLDHLPSSLDAGGAAPPVPAATAPAAAPKFHNTTVDNVKRVRPSVMMDDTRDAVAELLQAGHPAALPREKSKTISKALSTVLRHKADQLEVPLTRQGYARVDTILRLPQLRSHKLSYADIALMVQDSDKQRFKLMYSAPTTDDKSATTDAVLYIRANQGHSLPGLDLGMRAITLEEYQQSVADGAPLQAVHGTYHRAWQLIQACGYLSCMGRTHIHFARGLPGSAGVISGMRADVQVLLYLNVEKVLQDGVPLLESDNGVILTPGVGSTLQLPLQYVNKAVERKTGQVLPF